jgi:hypothetical protein
MRVGITTASGARNREPVDLLSSSFGFYYLVFVGQDMFNGNPNLVTAIAGWVQFRV